MSDSRMSSESLNGLLSSFLREGWSLLSGLEAAVDGLRYAQADDAADLLGILSHRLAGSAALYDLPQLAAVGGGMRQAIEGYFDAADDERRQRRVFLRRALDRARRLFEALAAFGEEGDDVVEPLAAEYPGYFPTEPAVDEATPATAADTHEADTHEADAEDLPEDRVVAALHLFRAQNPDVLEYFGPEAEEHIDGMTTTLAQIEDAGPSDEAVDLLFRQIHTLKGAAYTVGCLPIGGLSHGLEDVLVGVRNGDRELSGETADTVTSGVDVLRSMLAAVQGAQPEGLADRYAHASTALAALDSTGQEVGATDETTPEATPADGTPAPEEARDEDDGGKAADDASELPAVPLPAVSGRGATPPAATIRVGLDRLDRLMNLVGEVVVARSRISRDVERIELLGTAMSSIRTRMAHAVGEFQAKHLDPNLERAEGSPGQPASRPAGTADRDGATHVALGESVGEVFAELEWDRYDDFNILARRVGELSSDIVEVQGELETLGQDLREGMKLLQNLVRDLRSGVSRSRMVPVGSLFGRFGRLVRNLTEEEGKQVELELRGEGTEVDNAIMEAVADPVMHLVQNAVVHGIESPGRRLLAGKPEAGKLQLRAFQEGHFIHIEVADDGRGIDTDALRQRAIELDLIDRDGLAALDDVGVLELIYLPGLSTHAEASRAAGRGVGMDVVRANVSRINGEVQVDSKVGAGTRFTLRLPLTLLVSEALMVGVAGERMALPLAAVRQTQMLTPQDVQGTGDRLTVSIAGERMPVIRVAAALGLDAPADWTVLPGIVVHTGGRIACLVVDDLFGIEEVVIKAVSGFFAGLAFIAGATVDADGRVILLLDPGVLATPQALTAATAGAAGGEPASPAAAEPAASLTEPRILLVDDSLSVRKVLGSRLERAGFEVVTASDGEEAMQVLREQELDALVTDLEMPRVNGYELIEDTRRRPATRELPIVVITTRAGEKHLDLARRVGATRCFAKPIEERALAAHLRSITGALGARELVASGGTR